MREDVGKANGPAMAEVSCRICRAVCRVSEIERSTLSADGMTAWCRPCTLDKRRGYAARAYAKKAAAARAAGVPLKRGVPRDPEHEREMARRRSLKYARNNKDKRRQYHLKSRFGLTDAEVDAMVATQGGACALCRESFGKERMIDHDHDCCPDKRTCGKCVRGILCRRCNQGLGMLKEDPDLLIAAAMYVVQLRDALPPLPATT